MADIQESKESLQDSLQQVITLLNKHKLVEEPVHRQGMPKHALVESLVHKQNLAELQKKEREYADNLVKSIYDDLKAKKLTFEQALEKVQKDPNVGLESVYGAAIQSGPFLAVDYIEKRGLLRFDDVRGKIDALKEGEFSEPFVQKVDTSLEEGNPRLADSRWIIAKVDKIGEGGEKADDIISKTRQKYGVRIYLK